MSDEERAPSVKKTTDEVELPSGLKGTIRRIKLKVFDEMMSRQSVRKGSILEGLFQQAWVETSALGIYEQPFVEFPKDGEGAPIIDWHRILQGDRNVLLMKIRQLVRGDTFDFNHTCRLCRNVIRWSVDLNDLELYPLSEDAREQLRTTGKNEFERVLPWSEEKVSFKLLQGIDQNALSRTNAQSPDAQFVTSMLQRLVYIPGATKPKERRKWAEELDPQDADFLQAEWQEADCDVQTQIEIECGTCYKIQTIALPLDEDFLFRRSSRRKRR